MSPGKPAEISIDLQVPVQAVSTNAGFYQDGKLLAPLKPGAGLLRASPPPSAGDTAELELRCEGWIPAKTMPGSGDPRTLGVQAFGITVRNSDAGEKVFNANTGRWDAAS